MSKHTVKTLDRDTGCRLILRRSVHLALLSRGLVALLLACTTNLMTQELDLQLFFSFEWPAK